MKSFIVLSVFVVLSAFLFYQSQGLKRTYIREATNRVKQTMELETEFIHEKDVQNLPLIVKKYLKYTGTIGAEKVNNVRISAEGQFNMGNGWSKMTVEQFNFFGKKPARLSFMKLKVGVLPVFGLDSYLSGKGKMLGEIGGVYTIIEGTGPEMDQSELAVFLSEMCTTPAALVDKRITWEEIDPLTIRATFNDKELIVSGILYFNQKGELTQFTSEDKLYQEKDNSYSKVPWSVLISDYKEINGQKIGTYTKVVWHFSKGDFVYGKLHLKELEINTKEFH
ncbi:DUF6544 family protein [Neobacillus sp. LXY-4]|uniref:DUF6544 family protein n=1 Tax=Neobacillus sp. LXY-4 TaxID=3379826 RepID=UPI003EE30BEE